MPLKMIRGDIAEMETDVIVNATDEWLSGGGGSDRHIRLAAGEALTDACRAIGRCETGGIRVTDGYRLKCRYIIHTAGPVWKGGEHGEKELLTSCYRQALEKTLELGCTSVSFPLISSGNFGYPVADAIVTATDTIQQFLSGIPEDEPDLTVWLVLYSDEKFELSKSLQSDLDDLLPQGYAGRFPLQAHSILPGAVQGRTAGIHRWGNRPGYASAREEAARYEPSESPIGYAADEETEEPNLCASFGELADDGEVELVLDESFTEMLLRKIDERGMTDPECYKNANIDRKHFSKIRSDLHYRPHKETVFAFAIALRLDLDETRELLRKAGYALSGSFITDRVVEYFISKEKWNIAEINAVLFRYDQKLLGA